MYFEQLVAMHRAACIIRAHDAHITLDTPDAIGLLRELRASGIGAFSGAWWFADGVTHADLEGKQVAGVTVHVRETVSLRGAHNEDVGIAETQ